MYILGIDYGEKNIGLAVGDSDHKVTKPLEVVRRSRDSSEMEAIKKIIQKWEVKEVVIGVALNSDSEETISSRNARIFAGQLQEQFGNHIRIKFQSEVNSTLHSNQGLSRTQKKKMGDAMAAEYILQTYLAD